MPRRAWLFLGLTFAVGWGVTGAWAGLGAPAQGGASLLFGVGVMLVPGACAALLALLTSPRGERAKLLGLSPKANRWWLAGWLAPVAMALAANGFALLLPGVGWDPTLASAGARHADVVGADWLAELHRVGLPPFLAAVLQALLAGGSIAAVMALGEELGWRGLLHHDLGALGSTRRWLVTGIAWGLWHAPMVLQGQGWPSHPLLGVGLMVVLTTLLSPLLAALRERGGLVLPAALFHGTFNASFLLAGALVSGGSELSVGLTGVAGLATIAAVDVSWLAGRRARG